VAKLLIRFEKIMEVQNFYEPPPSPWRPCWGSDCTHHQGNFYVCIFMYPSHFWTIKFLLTVSSLSLLYFNKKLNRRWASERELFLRRHLQPLLRSVPQKLLNSVK